MKRAFTIITLTFIVLTFTGQSYGRGGMSKVMGEMGVKQTAGEVTAVDAKEKKVTVDGMRGPVTVTCDEKTSVKMGNEYRTCEDIKVGDNANVLFDIVEGKATAQTIYLSPPAAPSPEEKKAEPSKSHKK